MSRIVIVAAVFVIAGWWAYSSLTLETLGKADEVGLFGFLGEEYEDKTARDLGIEDLTVRSIVEYFRRKLSKDKEGDERVAAGALCARSSSISAANSPRTKRGTKESPQARFRHLFSLFRRDSKKDGAICSAFFETKNTGSMFLDPLRQLVFKVIDTVVFVLQTHRKVGSVDLSRPL